LLSGSIYGHIRTVLPILTHQSASGKFTDEITVKFYYFLYNFNSSIKLEHYLVRQSSLTAFFRYMKAPQGLPDPFASGYVRQCAVAVMRSPLVKSPCKAHPLSRDGKNLFE